MDGEEPVNVQLRQLRERYNDEALWLVQVGDSLGDLGEGGAQHELTRASQLLALVRDSLLKATLDVENT